MTDNDEYSEREDTQGMIDRGVERDALLKIGYGSGIPQF